jgi:hypothetical protein
MTSSGPNTLVGIFPASSAVVQASWMTGSPGTPQAREDKNKLHRHKPRYSFARKEETVIAIVVISFQSIHKNRLAYASDVKDGILAFDIV